VTSTDLFARRRPCRHVKQPNASWWPWHSHQAVQDQICEKGGRHALHAAAARVMGEGQAQLPTWPRLERRHQTRLRDRHWNPTSVASFRRRRPSPYERNAAISRHFERDSIPYALETDWAGWGVGIRTTAFRNRNSPRLQPGGTALELARLGLHVRELYFSTSFWRPLRRSKCSRSDFKMQRFLPPRAESPGDFDSGMQMFESRRLKRTVCL
jgi:hypothetical protein